MCFLSRLFVAIRAAFRPPHQEPDWAIFNQHSHWPTDPWVPDWATDTSMEPDWAIFNQHAHC